MNAPRTLEDLPASLEGNDESPWTHGVVLSGVREGRQWRAMHRQLSGVSYRLPLAPEMRFGGLCALVAFAVGSEAVLLGADRAAVDVFEGAGIAEGIHVLVFADDPSRVCGVLRVPDREGPADAFTWSLEVSWKRRFSEIGTGALDLAGGSPVA